MVPIFLRKSSLLSQFVRQVKNPRESLSIDRPVSVASSDYQTIPEKFPVTQPVTKIEADILVSEGKVFSSMCNVLLG